MIFRGRKIITTGLWLLLLISQPLIAGLTAEHLLSIKAGLNQPTDTAISNNGDIYSLNGALGKVIVFTKSGKEKLSFGRPGKGNTELNLPMGISIKNQQVFIADTGNARVSVFNLQGKFVRHILLKSEKPTDKTVAPVSLMVMENKIIWSDRQNHQLCSSKIDNGKTLHCWGSKGEADGQFNYPYQLASDDQDYIFAIDVLNARVQGFSSKGTHFMNTGRFGVNTSGSLFRPNGLALYEDNQLLVSDAYLGTISIYKNGRPLGLLTDSHAENLFFKSPTSLTLQKNKLYITDTLNNSIEVFRLNKTEPGKVRPGKSSSKSIAKPQPGSSRKNCISCHVSWADNYLAQDNDNTQVTPVAHQRMCYSCHHGVVIDSRKSIGHKQQHPDIHHRRDNNNAQNKGRNEDKDEIPKEFPLSSDPTVKFKELYCGSCHTPHKLKTDKHESLKGKHNNSWMREPNNSGEVCQQCHKSKLDNVQHKKRSTTGVNHPVGIYLKKADSDRPDKNKKGYAKDKNLHKGLPVEMTSAGASLNGRQQIICQSCHKVHGSDEQKLTAIKFSDAEMCVQCHQRHNAKDLESARKKGVHPVNIKLEDAVRINNKEIRFINCLTCHSTHSGKPNTALLTVDNKNGELCNICHEDYNKLVNTDHDLRVSAAKNKNRYDKTPEHTGACGTCHSMHAAEDNKFSLDATVKSIYKGKEKPLQRDQTCLNCHRKDGAAEKSQIKYFSHPTKDLILRSDKNKMPLLNKNNVISEFGEIGCITCHNPHRWSAHKDIEDHVIKTDKPEKNDSGNVLSSFLRNKEIQKSFCKNCHGIETRIKYKYYHLELSR